MGGGLVLGLESFFLDFIVGVSFDVSWYVDHPELWICPGIVWIGLLILTIAVTIKVWREK
jgi:hypothetical protein